MSLNKKEHAMSFAAELHCLQTYSLPSLCSPSTLVAQSDQATLPYCDVSSVNSTLQSPAKSLNETVQIRLACGHVCGIV